MITDPLLISLPTYGRRRRPGPAGAVRIAVQLGDDLRKVNSSPYLLLRRNVGGRIDRNDDLVPTVRSSFRWRMRF